MTGTSNDGPFRFRGGVQPQRDVGQNVRFGANDDKIVINSRLWMALLVATGVIIILLGVVAWRFVNTMEESGLSTAQVSPSEQSNAAEANPQSVPPAAEKSAIQPGDNINGASLVSALGLSRSPKSEIRQSAAQMLHKQWCPEAENRLIEMYLNDPEHWVRYRAKSYLKKSTRLVPVALEVLKNGSKEQQVLASAAISEFKKNNEQYTREIASLLPSFRDDNAENYNIYKNLLKALGGRKDTVVANALLQEIAANIDNGWRTEVAKTLVYCTPDDEFDLVVRGIDALQQLAIAGSNQDRSLMAIVRIFQARKDTRATSALIELLESNNHSLRHAVLSAISRTKDPAAARPLVDLFEKLGETSPLRVQILTTNWTGFPGLVHDRASGMFALADPE